MNRHTPKRGMGLNAGAPIQTLTPHHKPLDSSVTIYCLLCTCRALSAVWSESKSSHIWACMRCLQALPTVSRDAHTGLMCTTSRRENAVRLVKGHVDKSQNVRTTHHQGVRLPKSVDRTFFDCWTTKWYSPGSRRRPAGVVHVLSRPSWRCHCRRLMMMMMASCDSGSAGCCHWCRWWHQCGCRTAPRTGRCCDHGACDNATLSTYWRDWRRDLMNAQS